MPILGQAVDRRWIVVQSEASVRSSGFRGSRHRFALGYRMSNFAKHFSAYLSGWHRDQAT